MKNTALGVLFCFAVAHARAAAPPILSETTPSAEVQALDGFQGVYYQISQVRSFVVSSSSPSQKTLALYLGAEAGSPWLNGEDFSPLLSLELPKALAVFSQCGLGFSRVHLVVLRFNPAGLSRLADFAASSPYDPPFEFGLLQDLPAAARPMVVLLRQGYAESFNADSIRNLTAYYGASITKIGGLSFVPSDTDIGYDARVFAPSSYSLFAHEMAHVLGNLEHVTLPVPNIMNAGDGNTLRAAGRMMSTDMTPQQCAAVLSYPGVK